jgi:hypothetical protein
MIQVTQFLEQRTKHYTLHERSPGRRGQYTWSYQTTFGELTDPIALDLLDIAKAIFLADRAFPRSRWLGGQTRRLKVVIPVRKVRLWSGVGKLLESITRFVSADEWSIKFKKSTAPLSATTSARKEIDRKSVVALFSGGLDSLCGAAYDLYDDVELRQPSRRRGIQVFSCSSNCTPSLTNQATYH